MTPAYNQPVKSVDELRNRFTLPGLAEVQSGRNGLPCVQITSAHATGTMYLHGAHVTSWAPAGGNDVLFVSEQARYEDGRAIRGGIPVCFPWFGALAGRPDAPAHGCVRTKSWQLDAVEDTPDGVRVSMSTASDAETRRDWPFDFRLAARVTFGASLAFDLAVDNTGGTPFTFEEALHTYYRVGNVQTARVRGLEGIRYLDTLDQHRERAADDAIVFGSEVDRIYLGTAQPIRLDDLALGRHFRIETANSSTTVVWNPWIRKARSLADLGDDEWRHFVCVETCNVSPRPVPLGPGARHVMHLVIRPS